MGEGDGKYLQACHRYQPVFASISNFSIANACIHVHEHSRTKQNLLSLTAGCTKRYKAFQFTLCSFDVVLEGEARIWWCPEA